MQLATVVDILDHTHVLSRSLSFLSLFFPFPSLKRNNSDISAALNRRPESAFASRVFAAPACYTLAPLA